MKEEYNNNKFKLSAPTWSKDVTLPDGNYEISRIQNYFPDKVIKKHESDVKSNEQSPILIYPNKIINRVAFRIKTAYKLELLTKETMRLLGDGPIIDHTKTGENVPKLENVTNAFVFGNLFKSFIYKKVSCYFLLFPVLDLEVSFIIHHKY